MYVEQRLTACEVCGETLALQYCWAAGRPPTYSRDRFKVRLFACPSCGHGSYFPTLMNAYAFRLKLVPGPKGDRRVPAASVRPSRTRIHGPREALATYRGPDWERRALLLGRQALGRLEPWWPLVLWPTVLWYLYHTLAN